MGDDKLEITEPKNFHFDLSKDNGINLKHEIYSITKHNLLLADHTMKNQARTLFSKYMHRKDIHEHRKQ